MILLFFLSLVSPTSLVYYAAVEAEDATRYFAYGQIFFPICVACNLILFVAHLREKSWQNKFTALYLVSYFAVYEVASFVGQVFTNPIISDLNTENGVGLASAFPVALVFTHVPICYLLSPSHSFLWKSNLKKLLYPQYSNCFLLSVFLGVRLFIAPLTNVRP